MEESEQGWKELEDRLAGRHAEGAPLPPGATRRILEGLRAARKAISAQERASRSLQKEREARRALEKQVRDLRAEIKETHVPTARSDVVEGGVAGRSSLEAYRNTQLAFFDRHLSELPRIAKALGREGASLGATKGLLADLLTTRVAEPRTVDQARRRDVAEVLLSDSVLARTLSIPGQAGERWRAAVWSFCLRGSAEEAAWKIFEKSAEQAASKR